MSILSIIGRTTPLFDRDINERETELRALISSSRFLIIGAAGTIGQAVTIELMKRNPKSLHAVDLSENNMVELVRNIRSSIGYGSGDFRTFAVDCASAEFAAMAASEGPYDYVFNLSALKHVRSEKDPYTLMRLIQVNIINTLKILRATKDMNIKNYFCVSTDKAANPVNMMGASKRIMEQFLFRASKAQNVSMARFANVAFSDGSLLFGFNQRFLKKQPISAPCDVRRYFVTPQEAGELCVLAGLLGGNREIFFPHLEGELKLERFSDIAVRFITDLGYDVAECESENEARDNAAELIAEKKWPVFFFESDTTGEKDFEEFYTAEEMIDVSQFSSIGIIKPDIAFDEAKLDYFESMISEFKVRGDWSKADLVELFQMLIPNFDHKETGKYLDNRM
jgi:FlaA1/EpsC-like NDP-sugar epimerase